VTLIKRLWAKRGKAPVEAGASHAP
jgi:hypothetical protein